MSDTEEQAGLDSAQKLIADDVDGEFTDESPQKQEQVDYSAHQVNPSCDNITSLTQGEINAVN